jgi:excinuclease UvrABC nuclease subunit
VSAVPITNLQALPQVSGIYKVIDTDNNVVYIGQAKNIYERWNNGHHKISEILSKCETNAYIEWVELPEWLLNRAENAAVCFYQPPLNAKTPPIV